jgi:maltooligosyltrehalose trehalohydrolase
MYRGSLTIACNLGADAVDVPVAGEVVLAWGEPKVNAGATRLERHSFAILRSVKSLSTAERPVDN